MKKSRIFFTLALMLIISILAVGCGGGGGDQADNNDAGEPAGDTGEDKGLKIAIVTSSGVDDGSFGQSCYEGILAFIDKHPDCKVTDIKEPDIDKMIAAVESIVGEYDVLVLPGFQFAASGQIAEANPDKIFLLIDTPPTNAEGEIVE